VVECLLPKQKVEGSNPFSRSKENERGESLLETISPLFELKLHVISFLAS
jgi:hypothetical protein